jgi:glycosyltransferase involved in cell wall biosynthesis
MKILIITHYNFGSKSSGSTNRTLELAKAMSKYAEIKIIHQGADMIMENIKFLGYRSVFPPGISKRIPIATSHYISYVFPDLYRIIKEGANDVDVIQVEQPYLFIPALAMMKTLDKNPFMVLDEQNVDFALIKSKINNVSLNSLLTMITIPYIFLSENLAVRNANLVLCVSNIDQELLVNLYGIPEEKTLVVPNGVSLLKFENTPSVNDPILENCYSVFFHGSLDWYLNMEAVNIIIDYVAPKIPEVIFLIAGANLPAGLIKKLKKVKNVKYLGYLKSLEGWIKSSNVCIAPILRGGGTKLKVLEYAVAGKPIVATLKAIEGSGMANGVHGLFFERVDKNFIEGIKRVLNDSRLAEELGQNARMFAKKYDWTAIGKKLYEQYLKLVG